MLNAWPQCSEPVTFGGGIAIEYGFFDDDGSARKYPRSSHVAYQRASVAAGS
jgi:hypothetical protein